MQQPDHMAFNNIQIYTEHLPKVEQVSFLSLKAEYRIVLLMSSLLFWGISFFGLLLLLLLRVMNLGMQGNLLVLTGFTVLAVTRLIFVYLGYNYKAYALRDKDILYKEGIFWRSQTSVPFNRIQHCEVSQGPVERLFDLSKLQVFTAGGSSSDLVVPGLEPSEADKLKQYVLSKTAQVTELDEEE